MTLCDYASAGNTWSPDSRAWTIDSHFRVWLDQPLDLFSGPLTRYRAIEAAEVARAMVNAAAQPAGAFRVLEGAALFALGRMGA